MNCCFDKDILQEKLEGSLGIIENILLTEHLRNCESCQNEYKNLTLIFTEIACIDRSLDLPNGLILVRNQVLDNIAELKDGSPYKLNKFLRLQRLALKSSGNFAKYIPGTQFLGKAIKRAPTTLYRAFSFAMGRGMRFVAGRVRI